MKPNQKYNLIWVFLIGIVLAGCGQAHVNNSVTQASLNSEGCKKIAFVISTDSNSDIYTVCPDGSNLINITNDLADDSHPAWSPDGQKIAFASTREGSSQIYLMDRDGNNAIKLTSDYNNNSPVWLPDGNQIAFLTSDGEGLWWWRILNLEDKKISQFSEPSYDFFYQTPAWSPDGKRLAYMSMEEQKERNDGSSQIHVKNLDGSSDIALTEDIWANITPKWSPDGSKLAFLSERDGNYNNFALYVVNQDGTDLQKLSEPIYYDRNSFSWSPDGRQIVIESNSSRWSLFLIDVKSGKSTELLQRSDEERVFAPSWQP